MLDESGNSTPVQHPGGVHTLNLTQTEEEVMVVGFWAQICVTNCLIFEGQYIVAFLVLKPCVKNLLVLFFMKSSGYGLTACLHALPLYQPLVYFPASVYVPNVYLAVFPFI